MMIPKLISILSGTAHTAFKREVLSTLDEIQYQLALADRSKIPQRSDFNNIYSSFAR